MTMRPENPATTREQWAKFEVNACLTRYGRRVHDVVLARSVGNITTAQAVEAYRMLGEDTVTELARIETFLAAGE